MKNLNHNGSAADRDELTAFKSFVKFHDQHGYEEGGVLVSEERSYP